jgi:molybdopterin-guanine dinucleotide biosynthesis protein A
MNLPAVILAGGKSKRMGTDKTQLIYKGKSLLQHSIDLLQAFSDNIIISSNRPLRINFPVFSDSIPDAGPLGGLFTALSLVKEQKLIVLAADMPLLTPAVIEYLLKKADFNKQINIFSVNNKWQPLVGIYDTSLLPIIKNQITHKDYKLHHLLQKSSLHLIDGSKFAMQFMNVNSPAEWQKLNKNE